eukprot:TRINITY_DN121302_c0_g1_i1.p1 TRINITY_DN121302_c0_g1~~TRINITY_DN121302_c0_g1_i1.p1  ORF type:complete len:1334 (+),score=344.99 TRINITY_DN121302_c0_g1_i1:93-4094(+)
MAPNEHNGGAATARAASAGLPATGRPQPRNVQTPRALELRTLRAVEPGKEKRFEERAVARPPMLERTLPSQLPDRVAEDAFWSRTVPSASSRAGPGAGRPLGSGSATPSTGCPTSRPTTRLSSGLDAPLGLRMPALADLPPGAGRSHTPAGKAPLRAESALEKSSPRGDLGDMVEVLAAARPHSCVPALGEAAATSVAARRADGVSRLSQPRHQGQENSSRKQRLLGRAFEAHCQAQVAQHFAPMAQAVDSEKDRRQVAFFGDSWHMAGEDGYRSAVFHAAVRCRQLMDSTGTIDFVKGDNMADQVVFKGKPLDGIPELSRLHTALFLFQELCTVSSPLQEVLRFLLRELCACIFEGFTVGCDILTLAPFFSLHLNSRNEARVERERAAEMAEKLKESEDLRNRLESILKRTQEELSILEGRSQERGALHDEIIQERNQLRVKVNQLEELSDLRATENRELSADLVRTHSRAFDAQKDADAARKDANNAASALKVQEDVVGQLQRRIADLQDLLVLAKNEQASLAVAKEANDLLPVSLPASLEEEVNHRNREAIQQIKTDKKERQSTLDGKRLLKFPGHDGQWQLVLRGNASEDDRSGSNVHGRKENHSVLVVSRECFAALTIACGLPKSPDVVRLAGQDDEEVVNEVYQNVQVLAHEHQTLLNSFRSLRQELKATLQLIPEWNMDELRGTLQSVVVLDEDDAKMVPPPVKGQDCFIGLGEGQDVPVFLQFDGQLKHLKPDPQDTCRQCEEVLFAKTCRVFIALCGAVEPMHMSDFFASVFLPSLHQTRVDQMSFSYNFLHALRGLTTLGEDDGQLESLHLLKHATQSAMAGKGRGGRKGTLGRATNSRRSVAGDKLQWKGPAVSFHPGAEVLYRSLLGHLHEDAFHDATAMILSLRATLIGFHERLRPAHLQAQQAGEAGDGGDLQTVYYGLSELSAVLRLFFPHKPREHLSSLKAIIQANAVYHEDAADESNTSKKQGKRLPPVVDIDRLFGVLLLEHSAGESGVADNKVLADIINSPSQFIFELRYQHLCESLMFMERLQKAFRAMSSRSARMGDAGGGVSSSSAQAEGGGGDNTAAAAAVARGGRSVKLEIADIVVTPRQADLVLQAADNQLTEDQRCLYILRGFGERVPDPPLGPEDDPSTRGPSRAGSATSDVLCEQRSEDAEDSCSADAGFEEQTSAIGERDLPRRLPRQWRMAAARATGLYKVRRYMKDHMLRLHEDGATVNAELFLRRLGVSGVTKGSGMWRPAVNLTDVVQEAGLVVTRSRTQSFALEEFRNSCCGDGVEAELTEATSQLGRYRQHITAGSDIAELSVGYPGLMMAYWLSALV